VFVQPESEQQCLLGMNVLPALELTTCRANGKPLITKEGVDSFKGCFLKVKVDSELTRSERRYIPEFARITHPLHSSTRKITSFMLKNLSI